MNDQPSTPADPNIRIPVETPELRATVIAGYRAMAQFLEDNPEVPCPQAAHGQHSFLEPIDLRTFERVPVPDARKIAFVRAVAARLGVEAELSEHGAHLDYAVAARTTYTVHATLRGGEPQEAPKEDASGYVCDGCGGQADQWDEDDVPRCERCRAWNASQGSGVTRSNPSGGDPS